MELAIPELYDVVVVGAGAAGLQTAAVLLQRQPSLSIAILERCSSTGGRIRDVKFAEGIDAAGIGAWRVDPESKLALDILQRHGVPVEPWVPQVKRFEARGACVNSVEELRSHIFRDIPSESKLSNIKIFTVPDFLRNSLAKSLQENTHIKLPTRLGDVIRNAHGQDAEEFLSAISHGYKALANYDIDIMGTLASANAGTDTTRPVGGMSRIIDVLQSECTMGSAQFRYCANVQSICRTQGNVSGSRTYSITYVTSRGRILAGSDSLSAQDYAEGTLPNVIMARSVVLAIPPRAITRIAHRSDVSSASDSKNVMREIVDHPMFRSCIGVPAFRAAALYIHAWWDEAAMNGLQKLGERGTLLTSTSRLSMIMPYAGKGPKGETALHLAYCNDFDARYDGFWDKCIKNAAQCSGFSNSNSVSQSNRSRGFDEIVYQAIREELAKAFIIPTEDIPDPIRLEWYYWDDGAVHVQLPVDGYPSITRGEVEYWAVNGPLVS